MATLGASANMPIGSSQWIQNENDQLSQFLSQEIEDFGYAARNEVEWLNEHMADIFTKNQVYESLRFLHKDLINMIVAMSQRYSKPPESCEAKHHAQQESTTPSKLDRFGKSGALDDI